MLAFVALISACARLSVPMVPVPITLQTWAVLLAGVCLGPARGALCATLYLALAALGAPVLSDGAHGLRALLGPTGGYLAAFPLAAYLVGLASERGQLRSPARSVGWLMAVHLFILLVGAMWLARVVGASRAWTLGARPFLPGAVTKSLLVYATVVAARRFTRARAR